MITKILNNEDKDWKQADKNFILALILTSLLLLFAVS